MHDRTVERLNSLKENIMGLLEEETEQLVDSTNSQQLKNDLQRLIINALNVIPDNIEIIIEDIDHDCYDEHIEPDNDEY